MFYFIHICRVQDYIKNGLDVKYLCYPDGEVNLLRKKAHLGVLEVEEPQLSESFPKEGYKPELKHLPKVSFGTVWRFNMEGVKSKKQLSAGKPLVKGFNFFKTQHVLYIGQLHKNGKHFVKSQVLPSMKRDKIYVVVNFLSQVILFFLCFNFVSIHYHTQKQKKNKSVDADES